MGVYSSNATGCFPSCCLFPLLVPGAKAIKAQTSITTPEKFFGFQLGSDRNIARWDRIVEYYQLLEKEKRGRLKVVKHGAIYDGQTLFCW